MKFKDFLYQTSLTDNGHYLNLPRENKKIYVVYSGKFAGYWTYDKNTKRQMYSTILNVGGKYYNYMGKFSKYFETQFEKRFPESLKTTEVVAIAYKAQLYITWQRLGGFEIENHYIWEEIQKVAYRCNLNSQLMLRLGRYLAETRSYKKAIKRLFWGYSENVLFPWEPTWGNPLTNHMYAVQTKGKQINTPELFRRTHQASEDYGRILPLLKISRIEWMRWVMWNDYDIVKDAASAAEWFVRAQPYFTDLEMQYPADILNILNRLPTTFNPRFWREHHDVLFRNQQHWVNIMWETQWAADREKNEKLNKKLLDIFHEGLKKLPEVPDGRWLTTKEQYVAEGEELHHCVASYWLQPKTFILSLDRDGERSTAEYKLQNEELIKQQHRGYRNSAVKAKLPSTIKL